MSRRRGRPARPLPIHPERVISIAMKAGLSSTVRLQRAIKNKRTAKHFANSYEQWKIGRQVYLITKKDGNPDYSYIVKAEPGIRDNHLKMLYEKAAEFGHTEVQRQKNSDATVGPINQRLNACGAALREFSECNFPFPDPESFGTRTQKEGSTRKKFRVAGYKRTTFGPQIILVHPDLPSLDFGDAVRSHNEIIATECAIRNVSVRETTRYSNLFLLLARPYLERIYSENKYGRPSFRSGVNTALRQVKELIIEAGYQPQMYIDQSVTGALYDDASSKASIEFFDNQVEEASFFYGKHPALQELKKLRYEGFETSPGTFEPCLTVNDVEHIRQKAIRRGQLKGSILHRRISHLFPTPWSLRAFIYNEHEYSGNSDHVIVSELPLQTNLGKGKADITLFERVLTKDGKQALQRPALVCEIKTRMGHEWYLDSELKISRSRGRDGIPQRVVAEFPMNDRPMEDWEWRSIVDATPHPKTKKQVATYADALAQGFQEITGEESNHVYRATIMIDAISDINQVRSTIEELVAKSYQFLKKNKSDVKRTIITPTDVDCNIALVIHKQKVPTRTEEERIDTPWHPSYNPFKLSIDSDRRFILYLASESPTSSGTSAAWNAKYYHGLNLLYEMKEDKPNTKFLWLDLAGQFHEAKLAEARLKLRPRSFTEKDEVLSHHDHIREFFETVTVKNYLDNILSNLYGNGPEPSFDIKTVPDRSITIIISGIDVLKDTTPETHRDKLQLILDKLVTNLPDDENTTILWFDSPVPSVDKSIPYATRALLPYYSSSTLAEYTTEIIWNLPSPPRSAVDPERSTLGLIGDSPIFDDIRMIIKHSPKKLDIQFESIPLLQGWSRRFKNQGRGLIMRERRVVDAIPDKPTRERMKLISLTLVPWLVDLHPDVKDLGEPEKKLKEQFDELMQELKGLHKGLKFSVTSTTEPPGRFPRKLDLMRFRQPSFSSGKAFVPMTEGRINSQRLYRSPLRLKTTPRHTIDLLQTTVDTATDIIEETPEGEWLYGIKFVSEYDSNLHWWMVIQDPKKPSRMLVGCFLNKRIKRDDFHYSETKWELLTGNSVNEILEYKQLLMRYRITEQGVEVWNEIGECIGLIEMKSRGYSSVSHLRAIRWLEQEPPTDFELQPSIIFPSTIHRRVTAALKRYCDRALSPTPVSVKLTRIGDACRVTFIDKNDDVLQEVEHKSIPDLRALLRWPVTHGEPMHTDTGQFVSWNIFEDIEYSDMDFLRPLVIYRDTWAAPEEQLSQLSQFDESPEEATVEIDHDRSVCPLALREEGGKEGKEHGECWRILLHESAPRSLKRQLKRHMTGRMVHGLLASGRIWSGNLFALEIIFEHRAGSQECLVFQENDWIRRLLRERAIINLPSIPFGSYLKAKEEKWSLEIDYSKGKILWRATSMLTKRYFNPFIKSIELDFTNSLAKEKERLLNIIARNIGIDVQGIYEVVEVENKIIEGLEGLGFGDDKPQVELKIEYSESKITFILVIAGTKDDRAIVSESFKIDEDATREDIDSIYIGLCDEGFISQFDVVNRSEAVDEFNRILDGLDFADRDYSVESEPDAVLYLSLFTKDRVLQWEVRSDMDEVGDEGVFDVLEWLETKTIESIKNMFKNDLKSYHDNIIDLEEVLDEEFEDLVAELNDG